jgi:transcriptional regulator GlxA family with amidase domain
VKESAWRLRVENAIAPLLPHGEVSVQKVAETLGVSQRTLARRLGDESVTFLEVLNELRRGLARQYLCEDGLRIAEVAWLLGYRRSARSAMPSNAGRERRPHGGVRVRLARNSNKLASVSKLLGAWWSNTTGPPLKRFLWNCA